MTEILARFDEPAALAEAIRALRGRGYTRLDAITPYDVRAVAAALEAPRSRLTWVAGAAAVLSGALALLFLWWMNAHDYRLNVGGRPYFSFWTDLPLVYETMILVAALTVFFGFFVASNLPRLRHPWFSVDGTEDGFWLAVDTGDPAFEPTLVDALRAAGATAIERTEGATA